MMPPFPGGGGTDGQRQDRGKSNGLEETARKRHEITLDRLTEQALGALEMAKADHKPGDMLRAVELLAKMHGLFVDRTQMSIRHCRVEELFDEELLEIIARDEGVH